MLVHNGKERDGSHCVSFLVCVSQLYRPLAAMRGNLTRALHDMMWIAIWTLGSDYYSIRFYSEGSVELLWFQK